MKEVASEQPRIRVAAIVERDGAVLLVKHAKAGRRYWMLPGGGVGFGESLAEALVRELKEEVCLDVRPGELVLVNDSIPPDAHRHIVNLYFTAEVAAGTPRKGSDPRIEEVAFVPVATLPEITLFPDFGAELRDAIQGGFPRRAQYLGNMWKA